MYPDFRNDHGMFASPYMMGYGYPTYGMGHHMMGYPSYGMMHDPCCYPIMHYPQPHYHGRHHHGHYHHWHPENTQMQAQSMSLNMMPGMMQN